MQSPSLVSAWSPIWDALDGDSGERAFDLQAVKVRAHVDRGPADTTHAQAPHLTFGNVVADTMAAFGAACLGQTLCHHAEEAARVDELATLVMRRLVAISVEDTEANPRAKTKRGRGKRPQLTGRRGSCSLWVVSVTLGRGRAGGSPGGCREPCRATGGGGPQPQPGTRAGLALRP